MRGGTNSHPTTSEEANGVATDFVAQGIIGTYTNTSGVAPSTGAFAVNAQGTPDMTVAVSAGVAYVTGTPTGQNSQKFRVYNSASSNVTISANASGSTKYDWVYVKLDATLLNNPTLVGDTTATLVTSRSTSASTDDGTPPTYGYCIAVVTVANGASSITNSVIRDVRINATIGAVTSASTSWVSGVLPAVSSVTNNGNRSYDVTFASTVASLLSPGMRIRTTRTVTAPTFMGGAFNGSSHYFVKTTPTGTLSTVANNFTIMGWVYPTVYVDSSIAIRSDGTRNNVLGMEMMSSGQLRVIVANGGSSNYRYVATNCSVPLNRKTHVAVTWASGTFVIYLDGVAVPTATTTSGTAPTTAGTGGDFAIGRSGAAANLFFNGYISGVGVFDAVLTAATIKSYSSQVLSGSETNCIGAWSLNNTGVNQQAAGTNDLTATGGVSYTVRSPYSTNGAGTNDGIYDYALVMKVSTTTATVQLPEGCTIPTSGGVSAVAYSTTANPFGWVADDRWSLDVLIKSQIVQGAVTTGTTYNPGAMTLQIPKGRFNYSHKVFATMTGSTDASKDLFFGLSTANNSNSAGEENQTLNYQYGIVDQLRGVVTISDIGLGSTSATTSYFMVFTGNGVGTLTNAGFSGAVPSKFTLIPFGI